MKVASLAIALFVTGWAIEVGCQAPLPPGAATAAEGAYTAALLRCVDQAKTLSDSHACRQKVDSEWGVTEKEAGK